MAEADDRNTPPRANNRFTDPAEVERRMWRNIFAVVVAAIIVSAAAARLEFTLGLMLGGALALLNFKWLHASLRAVLEDGERKPPPGTAMKFIFRWVVIGLVIYIASSTGYFDTIAIFAGLFAPAVAAMVEAGYVTYRAVKNIRENDH
jgi:hypothetical protein